MTKKEQAVACGSSWLNKTTQPTCQSTSDFCPYSSTGLRYSLFNIFYNIFIKGDHMKKGDNKLIENTAVRVYHMQEENQEYEFTIQKIKFLKEHINYLDKDLEKAKQQNTKFDYGRGGRPHIASPFIIKELFRTSHGNSFEYGVINEKKDVWFPYFFILNYEMFEKGMFQTNNLDQKLFNQKAYATKLLSNISMKYLPCFILRNDIIQSHALLAKKMNVEYNGRFFEYKLVGANIGLDVKGKSVGHIVTGLSCEDTWYIFDSNSIINFDNWHEGDFSNYLNGLDLKTKNYQFSYYTNALYIPTTQLIQFKQQNAGKLSKENTKNV
jgi:hypothetical protein